MDRDVLSGARRILLVRLDNIGDVILLGPAIRAIREAHPEAHLALLASPAGALAAPLLPWLDEVVVERVVWQDASDDPSFAPAEAIAMVDRLRAGHWDAALIFTSFSQTPYPPAFAAYLAGIPIRAAQASDFGGAVISHRVESAEWEVHQADRNLHLVTGLGVPLVDDGLRVVIPGAASERTDDLLATTGLDASASFVLVVPGASCAARRYPASRYGEIAAALNAASGLAVVVAGTERESTLASAIQQRLPAARSLVGMTTVPELAALVARAALVICGNSAALHLADALRRPVVALYSGTDLEAQWAPRQTASVVLRRDTDCHPCYAMSCPFALECLDVDPAEAVGAGLALLDVGRRDPADRGERAATWTVGGRYQERSWTAFAS